MSRFIFGCELLRIVVILVQMQTETIQSKGGKARVAALTEKELSDSGKKAALARWGNRPIKAIRRGSFKEKFGIDVDCYVLEDEQKTAVISQSGMGEALGLSPRGNAFPRFLESKAMAKFVGAELRQKLTQPLKFQWGTGGAEQPPSVINGFDATLLIDVCDAIVKAEPELASQQKHIARQAHIINGASARAGIKDLVYALAGYSPTADEVIAAFKQYVQEEAKKYDKEFPPELYAHWYRLFQIPPVVGRGRPWQFKYLTVNHVYYPLAKSNGKILDLIRAMKAKGGDRKAKLFQFLSEIGARALSRQIGRVLEMAEDSPDKETYERKALIRFGGQPELDFSTPEAAAED